MLNICVYVVLQEPHPPRMSAQTASRRQARIDTLPPNLFEQLDKLRPFVEVRPYFSGDTGVTECAD